MCLKKIPKGLDIIKIYITNLLLYYMGNFCIKDCSCTQPLLEDSSDSPYDIYIYEQVENPKKSRIKRISSGFLKM